METKKRVKKNKGMKRIRFVIIVALICGIGIYVFMNYGSYLNSSSASSSKKTAASQETRIKITAVGDNALGRDYRFKYTNSIDDVFVKHNKDYKYFLAKVSKIFAADDLTIANLETALTTRTKTAIKYDGANNYWFKGDPKYANVLKSSSVEVVSLANNHTYDYKKEGYLDTRASLKKYGVGYYGYEDLYETEIKGIKIGIAGFNQLGNVEQGTDPVKLKAEVKSKIELLKSRNDLVIVSFHWGKEYDHNFNSTQQNLGHFAIDTGADLVIGHHPHVIEGIEKYKDKFIIYSLGNFSFGANKNPPDYDTFIYQQEFTFSADKKLIKINNPNYIPCFISTTKNLNNYQPVPATGSEAERILDKINKYSLYKTRKTSAANTKASLVDLKSLIPSLIINERYASTNNITGEVIYKSNNALLRKATADKLKIASDLFNKKGYKIMLWDSYRPQYAQQILWDKAVNKIYFMDPKKGSNHTKGCAVDITLTDMNGKQLDMPSDFDNMTGKATRKYKYATQKQKQNALLLEGVMLKSGFKEITTEWWHFEDSNSKSYEFIEE
jgi:D-alanyl-D-alanine dipeptidase